MGGGGASARKMEILGLAALPGERGKGRKPHSGKTQGDSAHPLSSPTSPPYPSVQPPKPRAGTETAN